MAVCGDITDLYIQDQINIADAQLIISTIPDFKSNLALANAVERKTAGKKKRPKLIFAAQDEEEAKQFYAHEIDYAISPHFIGSQHLAKILQAKQFGPGLKKLREYHLKALNA